MAEERLEVADCVVGKLFPRDSVAFVIRVAKTLGYRHGVGQFRGDGQCLGTQPCLDERGDDLNERVADRFAMVPRAGNVGLQLLMAFRRLIKEVFDLLHEPFVIVLETLLDQAPSPTQGLASPA